MKLLSLFLLSASFIFTITSCNKEPEENYPIEPTLTFENIEFKKGVPDDNSLSIDTVIITIIITDGDGDFGRKDSEIGYEPFNAGFYINKSNGSPIPWEGDQYHFAADTSQLIKFGDRSTPPYDTLPAMPSSYYINGVDHDFPEEPLPLKDYLYYKPNRDVSNLMIDGYMHNDDGSFENLIDVVGIRGQYFPFIFDYNIPSLEDKRSSYLVVEALSPKKARVTLKFASILWRNLPIDGRHVKFNLLVKDHALHSSNSIETPPLTIE